MKKIFDTPTHLPTSWLVFLCGSSVSAIFLVITLTMWFASLAQNQKAVASEVATLQKEKSETAELKNRVIRIETILEYAFPAEARRVHK